MIVLLKLALTCAVPLTMFLRSRRRRVGAPFDLELSDLESFAADAIICYFLSYFLTIFLPAIGLALPLRVRAFVCVR